MSPLMTSQGIMTASDLQSVKEKALKLFKYGQEVAAKNGLLLVDTKYEFGKDEHGNIIIVDEMHTPDSSRYNIYHYGRSLQVQKSVR